MGKSREGYFKHGGLRKYDLGSDGKPIAEFGNSHILEVPRNVINVLPQIRREFDPVKLQELADSMPLADNVEDLIHELMEPVVEGLHDKSSAIRYLEQFNRANADSGCEYTLDDLVPWVQPNGVFYAIHIAGERRLRAMDILVDRYGYSEESTVVSSVHENISFVDALPLQFKENNARINPSKGDEARAMRGYINLMRELDPEYTKAECARAFAVKPYRVHEAYVFTGYPASLQVMEKYYPFTWLIGAEDIYKTWLDYYEKNGSGVIDPMRGGLFGGDETREAFDKPPDMWTTSDGLTMFASAEDAAAHEVEICFMKIKAEQLERRSSQRKNEVRKQRDVRLKSQLEAIKREIKNEPLGIGQRELPKLELTDQEQYRLEIQASFHKEEPGENIKPPEKDEPLKLFESFRERRKLASSLLFEAALKALWLLEARGDLTDNMRKRLGIYAMIEGTADTELVDVSETDELFESND